MLFVCDLPRVSVSLGIEQADPNWDSTDAVIVIRLGAFDVLPRAI